MKKTILIILICVLAVALFAAFSSWNIKEKPMQDISQTDPELAQLWQNFMDNEVTNRKIMPINTRYLTVMAAHIATGSVNEYKNILTQALDNGVSPLEVKEALYQSIPYAGMAKVYDLIFSTNEVMLERGIKLPLEPQSTTNPQNRFDKGLKVQSQIFGSENIASMRASAPKELKHIQDYLSANCFGDYYTRGTLDIPTRELITLAVLISLGGADPQVKAHVGANLNVGNSREMLIELVTQLLPYIGYPRSLNAIAAINEIAKE